MNEGKTISYFFRFGEVFESRLFQIPDYQRGYSWEKKQWEDLIYDLNQLREETQQHFFGTIVLHAQDIAASIPTENGQPYRRYDIVDGQQRLITMVIFLNALAKAMSPFDEREAEALRKQAVFATDSIGIRVSRLRPNLDTADFFQSNILELSGAAPQQETPMHQRLREAKMFFEAHIAAKRLELGSAFPRWLSDQVNKITSQFTVLLYAAEQEADAALIFAAMNDRGQRIVEMEKVKSHLLYLVRKLDVRSDVDLVVEINKTWKHIYSTLAAAGLTERFREDQLLRYHWLMAYDPQSKHWKGADTVKARFDLYREGSRPDHLFKEILEYLRTMRSATTTFCDVYRPSRDGAFADLNADRVTKERIQEIGEKLIRTRAVATFVPLLMAVRLRHPDNALEYLETAELCEIFAFRVYRWRGSPAHTGQARFFRLASQLYLGRDLDGIQDEIRRLILHYCSNARFAARFESTIENWYNWSGLKYFLYEYEQHLLGGHQLQDLIKWEKMVGNPDTIEHILPQTPDTDGYWSSRFRPDEYERYRHDIGNLTLTVDNGPMSNKPFYQDVPLPEEHLGHKWYYYHRSPYFMERDLCRHKEWTPVMIEERREEIMKWATKRWHIDPPPEASSGQHKTKKYSLANIQDLARERGVRDLYDRLLEGFGLHGVRVRPWQWCVTLAPPQGKQYALGVIYPQHGYVAVGLWLGNFPRYYRGITTEDVEAMIGPIDHQVNATNINDFLARVDRLFAKVEGTK